MRSRNIWICLVAWAGSVGCDVVVAERQAQVLPEFGATITGERRADDPSWKGRCAVQFVGSAPEVNAVITSKGKGKYVFHVTNMAYDETIKAKFAGADGKIQTDVGVPHWTLNQIRECYEDVTAEFAEFGWVKIGTHPTYTLMPGAKCSTDEFAMIVFFVDEWFYYG